MTVKEADRIIRRARLNGFGGNCGRVAVAINRVLFDGKGAYVVATNPHISKAFGRTFMGHVVVEWKGVLFDATGAIEDEESVEAWGMVDPEDSDWEFLTDDEAHDGQMHYLEGDRGEIEREIMRGTRGSCSIRDTEKALREAMHE